MPPKLKATKQTTQNAELFSKGAEHPKEAVSSRTRSCGTTSNQQTEKLAKNAPKSASACTSPRRLTGKSPGSQISPNGATLSISKVTNARETQVKRSLKAGSRSKSDNKGQSATFTRVSPKSAATAKKRKSNPSKDCAPSSKTLKIPKGTADLDLLSPLEAKRPKKNTKRVAEKAPKSASTSSVSPSSIKVKIPGKNKKQQVNNSNAKSELNNKDIKERTTAAPKRAKRSAYQSETFKRYSVIVPSIDEMVAEKNSLVRYRQHVEEAQKIETPTFVWPSLPQLEPFSEPMLDCKSLTLDELTDQFNINANLLVGISAGQTYSDRHQRYHNSSQWQHKFTPKDLTYNTSTIVFSFEQVDHLATLIDGMFPDQSKYVFQVLLPELCLKIFMNKHDMSKLQAKKYLDMRPVE